jgi:hypothetical protein
MSNDRDPILDAMLSEALGGRTPPDLTARVLQAWAARGVDPARADHRLLEALQGVPLPPPVAADTPWLEPVAPPVQPSVYNNGHAAQPMLIPAAREASVSSVARKSRSPRKRDTAWLSAALAIGVLVGGSALGYALLSGPGQQVVEKPEETAKKPAPAIVHHNKPRDNKNVKPRPAPSVATNQENKGKTETKPPMFGTDDNPKVVGALPKSEWTNLEPSSDHEIVQFIGETLHASWDSSKVKPSPPATDAEWCRRVYLRLVGRIPNVEELSSFTGSKAADKRTALVDRLLFDEQYADEFTRYWATQWSNTLIGRSAAMEKDGLASAEGLQKYLRDAIQANKPYDKIVQELIAATGSGQPGAADFNGAANFLLASQNEDATLATARTSRIFLGQQLQCAQCHDHPFNDGRQQHQFWAMNAFFRQMAVEKNGNAARLVNRDFRGESGDVEEADVFFEQRNGQMKVAYPAFVDGTEIPRSGLVSEVDRRAELARMIAASDDLSRAMINRTWAHFLGYGFTRPIDDMGAHNAPSHPEVLERLAKEFKAHGYNTKSLLRWVALSEPFGLSSKIQSNNLADAPQMGTAPLFSHYYTRQMQAEELYDSLIAASQIAKAGGSQADQDKARLAWLGQFSQSLKTDEGDEEHSFNGTIPQSLMMLNGQLMQDAISSEHSALLKRVADSKMQPLEKIEHLFLAAVARKPVERELKVARQLIATHDGDVNAALSDVWWALLNSNEFILDH